jgi:hypothetical protein
MYPGTDIASDSLPVSVPLRFAMNCQLATTTVVDWNWDISHGMLARHDDQYGYSIYWIDVICGPLFGSVTTLFDIQSHYRDSVFRPLCLTTPQYALYCAYGISLPDGLTKITICEFQAERSA